MVLDLRPEAATTLLAAGFDCFFRVEGFGVGDRFLFVEPARFFVLAFLLSTAMPPRVPRRRLYYYVVLGNTVLY